MTEQTLDQRSRIRSGASLFLALVAVLCLGTTAAQAEPVYSKSLRFRIPFQFDAAELERLGAEEIQLFVSRDQGTTWKRSDKVPPQAGRFTFEAAEDGSYWFSVKTVTSGGLEYPAGPHQASLHVIVDSTPPTLTLSLTKTEPGRVRLSWVAEDEHLDLDALKLEFTEPDGTAWTPVAIRNEAQGQTSWTVTAAGKIRARGSVSDGVGNVQEASAELQIDQPSIPNAPPEVSQPVANETKETIGSGPSTADMAAPKLPDPEANLAEPTPAGPVTAPVKKVSQSPLPAIKAHPAPVAQASQPKSHISPLPTGTHAVNTQTFRMGYAIDDVGPSGVGRVDLYITEDGGRRWFHYGIDPDRQSPIDVTVPHDGQYGFSFRIANGLGRVTAPPQPGERPEVQILVDQTAPVARLLPLRPGLNLDANKVIIEWSAEDRYLPQTPVSLFYSVTATGPWQSLNEAQPLAGRLAWPIPDSLNQPFFVRLDVRDIAGNVTTTYSEKPFLVDRSTPQARVTDVESLKPTR